MASVRPTKKQRELLDHIEAFIAQHGYSPSYREIMNGLHYNSVATVALHVSNLIKRGHLRKRDHSARSLEVVREAGLDGQTGSGPDADAHTAWLAGRAEACIARLAEAGDAEQTLVAGQALVAAFKALDLPVQAENLQATLTATYNSTP